MVAEALGLAEGKGLEAYQTVGSPALGRRSYDGGNESILTGLVLDAGQSATLQVLWLRVVAAGPSHDVESLLTFLRSVVSSS